MLQRLRQISISSSLRGAFLTGALLTLIVSSVSLYSWHEQSSQIRYSLDEYFPRIHAAFLIEGNLNLVVDQLNEFLLAPNTTVRLQLRNQIIQHLDKIERLSQGLLPAERQQLGVILQDSRALLAELDRVLYNMFLVREKVGELAARIDWLHDDFTTELNSLVQDFTWQQGTLLDQIEARQGDARQYLKRAREVQNEQQQVYTLARIENQIVDDLRDRLNELKSGNDDGMLVETHIRYLENLKKTADENIRALDDWPSTITLRQTIDELLEIGMVKLTVVDYDEMWPALFENERTLLQMTLGKVISRIHHIGSTSVPGLSAKPVIDILIEVANLEELDSLNQAMEGVGYTVRGENGILNRRYFTKGGNQRSHHIHAFATGDAQIIKHLAFRDYLIKHNDVAIQYALMKKSAMLLCENDSHRYSIYKADFIQKHLRMALIDAGHLG